MDTFLDKDDLVGLLAKAIKVAGQFVDMDVPTAVSKNGWYWEDALADLVVRSSGIDADFLSRSSEREQQSAVAARQKGEAIFMCSDVHPMFFRNQWAFHRSVMPEERDYEMRPPSTHFSPD